MQCAAQKLPIVLRDSIVLRGVLVLGVVLLCCVLLHIGTSGAAIVSIVGI